MPLFSDLSSYYYTGSMPSSSHYYHMPTSTYSVPSRIATPFSFSYLSPLTAMMSAGVGINPMPRGLMSRSAYTPILPSISETSSPILSRRDVVSPRSIAGKVYYRAPRPVVIDTADIDVSKRKKDKEDTDTSASGRIHRGRSVVRIHTKKLKENPGLKKKKTQGELLMEKFLIKEKPEPKEEPKRRRVWETEATILEDTIASPPQVTPTVSPAATPVCRRGTIKRYISGVRKKSGPLPDVEGTEEGDASADRKVSINELLKEEAAMLDSMIQEEMAKPANDVPTKRKKTGELPDIDDTGTKCKTKTKREGKLYGGKKSSKTLPLDSIDKNDETVTNHYVSKKSSKALPLDEVNDITNGALSKVNEDDIIAKQKQPEGKVVRKIHKSYKKKHSGPLKFIIGSVHVEEKSSPKPARKLNYEVIIEESTHNDGTKETLRDFVKKRKSKPPSVKKHHAVEQKGENEDYVKIHNKVKSEKLTSKEGFDSQEVVNVKERLDISSDSREAEECGCESGEKDDVNKSGENNVECDGKKLAIKNFLENVIHKTDTPQMKDDVKSKLGKNAVISKASDKTKNTDNATSSREEYYEKFKTMDTLFKNAKDKTVTVDKKNEISSISAKSTDQDESKETDGSSLNSESHTKCIQSFQPTNQLKSIHAVEKASNKRIIPDVMKSSEEKKTDKKIEIPKRTEAKFLQKFREVPRASEQLKPPQTSDIVLNTDNKVVPSKDIDASISSSSKTVASTDGEKENKKLNYTTDEPSITEKMGVTNKEVLLESEKSDKVEDKEITKEVSCKTETDTKVVASKETAEKAELKVGEKYRLEKDKSMNKSNFPPEINTTVDTKQSQNNIQGVKKKPKSDIVKQELSSDTGNTEDSKNIINTKKLDNLNLTDKLISPGITKPGMKAKDYLQEDIKQFPLADNLESQISIGKQSEVKKETNRLKKDEQDVNKFGAHASSTSQSEEKVTLPTSDTVKITPVDSNQLVLVEKTKPLVKTRKSDVTTLEIVHEPAKIEKCKVGGTSEATPLSDKHVDSNKTTVSITKSDTVTKSVEAYTPESKQVDSETPKENTGICLGDSVLPTKVVLTEVKDLVKEDSSDKNILTSQSGFSSKEIDSSLSFDKFKSDIENIQELKEQVEETEGSLKTAVSQEVLTPDSQQPVSLSKADVPVKTSKLINTIHDVSDSLKTEDISTVRSTSDTGPATSIDKLPEEVESDFIEKKGTEVVTDNTATTVSLTSEVKGVNKTATSIEAEVDKDTKSKPMSPKDLSPPLTDEPKIPEKIKTLGKSESSQQAVKSETVGTVKENIATDKAPLDAITDVVSKAEGSPKVKKLVKSHSKDDDKQTESKSTVKAVRSPKTVKPEESKPSTKRKPLVKKKSSEVAVVSENVEPKMALSKEEAVGTETSEKTALPADAESIQKKTETVAKAKAPEKTVTESSCVKQSTPKKINTVIKVKNTDKTVDESVNSETSSVRVPEEASADKHFENDGTIPSPESSSDEESSSEEESSDEEETSSKEETSTEEESSDDDECDVNCHRKCEKLMPNLCGINQKLIVEALTSVKKGSVESKDKGSPTRRQSNAALSLESLSSDSLDGFKTARSGRVTPPATTIPRFRKYCIEDFQFLKVLGKGSFGKVLLAELKGTQYYYAVKCLKKDVVLEDDDVECTLIERKVLVLGTKHPYLCHLFCTFQTNSHLFFVMEYLNGGDLMFHIQQEGRFDEGRARFYGAEIVSGLKFLHKKGIIYRDLKLDNILLDFDGHVRIADFGMCKLQIYLDRTADTFCGTPDYMAPEIIKGLKYNQCVDWWSFGILLYEMLVGQSPFSGCDEDDLFWCVCNKQPQYPRFITVQAKKILSQLLEKESSKRLGSSTDGATDVMMHTFFEGLDWQRLDRRELIPPFKPNVKHPLDVQYFDKAFTAERARLTPIEPSILQSMDQTQFNGFSYTNPNVTE